MDHKLCYLSISMALSVESPWCLWVSKWILYFIIAIVIRSLLICIKSYEITMKIERTWFIFDQQGFYSFWNFCQTVPNRICLFFYRSTDKWNDHIKMKMQHLNVYFEPKMASDNKIKDKDELRFCRPIVCQLLHINFKTKSLPFQFQWGWKSESRDHSLDYEFEVRHQLK